MNAFPGACAAAMALVLTLVSCSPPEAPEDPSSVSTRLQLSGAPGYTIRVKDQGQALHLPWSQETSGTLDLTLVATPKAGQPEPVWYVEFPDRHVATYHRREFTILLYKTSVTVHVEAEATPQE